MSLKIECPATRGHVPIASPERQPLDHLRFSLLFAKKDEGFMLEASKVERVLVLLAGKCDVEAGDSTFSNLGRKGVFEEKATAVYVPVGSSCSVVARTETEVAIISSDAEVTHRPQLIPKRNINVRRVGRLNWYREVHDIVTPAVKAQRLLVGETYNPSGNWSSYPPHRHGRDAPPAESRQEELYHFRLDPASGFGLQRIYTDDHTIDETIVVKDRDTVVIPGGYHPVVAAPGYRLYYLWALAGESRNLIPYDDPQHSWVGRL